MKSPALYHYCSGMSFSAIVSSRKLRLSDITLSNDSREGMAVQTEFEDVCANRGVDEFISKWISQDFRERWESRPALCLCLSEVPDLLSQWRGYADDGYGFCIGFRQDAFDALEPDYDVFKVSYGAASGGGTFSNLADLLNDTVTSELADHMRLKSNLGDLNGSVSATLNPVYNDQHGWAGDESDLSSSCSKLNGIVTDVEMYRYHMKALAFNEEREWRILRISTPAFSGFFAERDRVKGYIELSLTADMIDRVWIGPKNITPENVILSMFETHDLNRPEIIRSSASYR